jgi:ribosomal protein L16/L10AE
MNTSFHHHDVDRAYVSLALTADNTTLHVRMGLRHLEIQMVSSDALEAAMQLLRRRMTISLKEIRAIRDAWNEATMRHRTSFSTSCLSVRFEEQENV